MMQTTAQTIDLEKLAKDKRTQKQFCEGLEVNNTSSLVVTKEFVASGIKSTD